MLDLALGPLIAVVIRLIVPLAVLRWPLWGALAGIAVDTLDVVVVGIIGKGDFPDYSRIDKLLDSYFLLFLLASSLKWTALLRNVSIALFAYRMLGVVIFEVTGARWLLLIFPNLFQLYYLFVAAKDKFFPQYKLTAKRLAIILLLLLIPKLLQEYMLHYVQFGPWSWLNSHFFGLNAS